MEKLNRQNLEAGGQQIRSTRVSLYFSSFAAKPRPQKPEKKNHGGWGFNEQSPDQVSVPCIVHGRGTELQNHDVRFFCFSLSSPSHFLNLAGAGPCSSPRRARLNAEKLALHGLESKRQRGTHTNERRRSHLNPAVVPTGGRDGNAQREVPRRHAAETQAAACADAAATTGAATAAARATAIVRGEG